MTNLLLDTHVMVWSVFAPEMLSRSTEREILHARRVFIPAPALYEAVRAMIAGRVKASAKVTPDALMDLIAASGFDVLHADANDWIEAAGLGWRHGDPFDRLIYTMAHVRNLALVTADETLLRLGGDGMVDAR